MQAAEYIADVDAALMILETQTANFASYQGFLSTNKDYKITVQWIDDCRMDTPQECTPNCDIEGTPIGALDQEYEIECMFESDPWQISEVDMRSVTSDYNAFYAKSILKAMKLMDEEVSKTIIAEIDANAGNNTYSGLGITPDINGDTIIPPSRWSPDIFAYLEMAVRMNRLTSARILDSHNLWPFWWKIQNEVGDANAGARNKYSKFGNIYFDPVNITEVTGDAATYLIQPSSNRHL